MWKSLSLLVSHFNNSNRNTPSHLSPCPSLSILTRAPLYFFFLVAFIARLYIKVPAIAILPTRGGWRKAKKRRGRAGVSRGGLEEKGAGKVDDRAPTIHTHIGVNQPHPPSHLLPTTLPLLIGVLNAITLATMITTLLTVFPTACVTGLTAPRARKATSLYA